MTPDRILETALYVDDLDAAAAFYGDLIGLETLTRVDGRHHFFRCGDGVLLLFVADQTLKPSTDPRLPVPPHGTKGPGHACFAVDGTHLDDWRQRLADAGIAIEADFRWPNTARSIYVRDPAGNSIELAEPKLWGLT